MDLHPSTQILDSSKIQDYLICPRKYFYSHILGWRREEPNVHLIFGEAWHRAMEVIHQSDYSLSAVEKAASVLHDFYRQHFNTMQDEFNYPKTPGFATEMLMRYVNRYKGDLHEFEVIHTEVGGRVSVGDNKYLHFRMDTICKYKDGPRAGKYFSLEHKTTKTFKQNWMEQWSLKTQGYTYYHVLRCMYGSDAHHIVINGAQFQKTNPDFTRLPLIKTDLQMEEWLSWLDRIMRTIDIETLILQEEDNSQILCAFPKNTESCTHYGLCAWHSFCTSWANPLHHAETPPMGYIVQHWNPLEKEVKVEVDL